MGFTISLELKIEGVQFACRPHALFQLDQLPLILSSLAVFMSQKLQAEKWSYIELIAPVDVTDVSLLCKWSRKSKYFIDSKATIQFENLVSFP